MRARDKPTFPTAPHDGLYGCCHCGNYTACLKGDKLACGNCRTATPLVYCGNGPATTRAQAPPAQQSSEEQS